MTTGTTTTTTTTTDAASSLPPHNKAYTIPASVLAVFASATNLYIAIRVFRRLTLLSALVNILPTLFIVQTNFRRVPTCRLNAAGTVALLCGVLDLVATSLCDPVQIMLDRNYDLTDPINRYCMPPTKILAFVSAACMVVAAVLVCLIACPYHDVPHRVAVAAAARDEHAKQDTAAEEQANHNNNNV